ncbi:MAG: ComEC/Rec2 family competence protein [Candidatus Bilamarchaeum sp.]|jgi:competence protein ComEC
MKKIIIALLIGLLAFGCLGIGETPKPTQNISEPPKPSVNVSIKPQQNQTIDPRPGTNNTTITNQTNQSLKEIDYIEDLNQNLGVYFIDVGGVGLHGSAILIKKGDFDMLVDAGPKQNESKVVDFLRSKNVDDIDVLVSTAADPRNYGGIDHVLNNYRVEQFWFGGKGNDQSYNQIVDRVTNASKKSLVVNRGFRKDLNGIVFQVLNPTVQNPFSDVNNDAVVLRVQDRNFTLLLSSNIQTGAQGRLINEQTELIKTAVMQAPYYGVGAGTGEVGLFLIGVNPKNIIITGSADDSATNGGSRDPFKRYMRQYNVKWNETYVNGSIRVVYDGNEYSIDSLGVGN